MGTLRFFEEVVSFKIRRTFGFADYTAALINESKTDFSFSGCTQCGVHPTVFVHRSP